MKRRLAGILVIFILLLIAATYLFIPSKLTISRAIRVNCNYSGADRWLGQEKNWVAWWPAAGYRTGRHFSYVHEVKIDVGDSSASSWLSTLPSENPDTTNIQWTCDLRAGWSPLGRVRQYQVARTIGRNMSSILENLRRTAEKEGVYGFIIRNVSTKDSFLVIKRSAFPAYPSTSQIYGLLKDLQEYSSHEDAKETGYPMVNITPSGKDLFQVMVALPVDKELKAKGGISPRKMVNGQFLVTEVKGGPAIIDEALGQMKNYVEDHHQATMAIPFQSLVTDRSREPDSSRWVTRLYYPVY
jgi:hypothetical protein